VVREYEERGTQVQKGRHTNTKRDGEQDKSMSRRIGKRGMEIKKTKKTKEEMTRTSSL
jgi:hypothetical protein